METMTKREIKTFAKKITKDQRITMQKAQENYAFAKALNETNLAIDLEAKREELTAFDYPYADKWHGTGRGQYMDKFIKDPRHDYLMADEYCNEYWRGVHERRKAKGWKCNFRIEGEPEYIVTADAESRRLLKTAEDILIDAILETVPTSLRADLQKARTYPHREKLINIAMKWDTRK